MVLLLALFVVPSLGILLPNHNIKSSNTVQTTNVAAESHTAVRSSNSSDAEQTASNFQLDPAGPIHSKPMILPYKIPTNSSWFAVGPSQVLVDPIPMVMPVVAPAAPAETRPGRSGTKLLNDLFGPPTKSPVSSNLVQLFSPAVFNKTNGTIPSLKDVLIGKATGKLDGLFVKNENSGLKLPEFDLSKPQIASPPSSPSIVNPFIPPVAVKKNGTKASPSEKTQIHILPFLGHSMFEKPLTQPTVASPKSDAKGPLPLILMAGPQKHPRNSQKNRKKVPMFNTNLLAGSPVMKLLSNLSSDCQKSFSNLAKGVVNLTIADFKEKFTNWSVQCGKEDIVQELENRTETIQQNVRANMTTLIQTLPLYVQGLQSLEKNDSMTVAQKMQAVSEFMGNISDPNVAKTIIFMNKLFLGEMITQFFPSLSDRSTQTNAGPAKRLQSVHPKKNGGKIIDKRSAADSYSKEDPLFEIAGSHDHL